MTYQIRKKLNTSILRLVTLRKKIEKAMFCLKAAEHFQVSSSYIIFIIIPGLIKVKETFQREVNNLGRSPGKDKVIG